MDIINNDNLSLQISSALKTIQAQNILYKYTELNTAIEHIISNNTLKFSNPKDFNDPFDCHEGLINVSKVSGQILENIFDNSEAIRNSSRQHLYEKNKKEIIKRVNDKNRVQSLWKEMHSHYRVSCFSKVSDNTLMWSHYGDKHNGVVVGIKLPFLHNDFVVYPVLYTDKIAPIDGMTDAQKVLYYWITTKSHHWSYEQEFRAISKNSKEIISFEKEWLTEVIFGCKVSDKQIKNYVSYIRNKLRYKNILIKRMIIDCDTFSLKEEIIADIQDYKNKIK